MKKFLLTITVLLFISCSKNAEKQQMNAIFDMYGSKVEGVSMDGGLTYEFDLKKLPADLMSREFIRKVCDKTDSFTDSRPELDDFPSAHNDGSVHGTTYWHTPKYRIVLIEIINRDKDVHKMVYQLVVK